MSTGAPPGSETAGPVPDLWLTAGVKGIGSASLLSDLGHEVPTALLPSFLTSTLGAPAAALGLIEGIADGLAGAAKFAGGPLADDPRRRRNTAVGGYAATAVLSAAIGAATSVAQVAVLRAGSWAARGLRVPARNALLADVVPPTAYGRAYGFERAMDNLGAIGGPLLAIVLVASVGVRTAILVSVVPGLLAALAIVYAVRHAPRLDERERTALRFHVRPVLRGRLGRLFVGIGAFEAGNAAATLLILRATELLDEQHSHETAVNTALVLYAGYNVAATIASLQAGRLGDRRGMLGILAVGVGAFLAAYTVFAFATPNVVVLAAAFLVAGVGIGFVETAEHAAVATHAPDGVRGSAFGLLAATQSLGNLVASAVAGVLWTAVSPSAAFLVLAGAMLFSLVALRLARD